MGQLVMPKMGDTMEEGTIARWLKKPGDQVNEGDTLAEIETEKSVMEMTAFESGVLEEILLPEGQTVPVGTPIAVLRTVGEAAPAPAATTPPPSPARPPEQPVRHEPAVAPTEPRPEPGERVKASPLARRLAEAKNVDLRAVTGTGPGGRVLEADVEEYLSSRRVAPAAAAATPASPPVAPAPATAAGEVRELNRIRRTIARRMTQSKQTIPHFYVTAEVDMKRALELRAALNDLGGDRPKISLTDMMVKAAAIAIARNPEAGAQYQDDKLHMPAQINVGIAVALEDGLVVPVVRDCGRKSLTAIARESRDLIERARQGKLAPDEYTGGTITISNLGMYEVDSFAAIINPPEPAILAVGSVTDTPVVVEGQVVIRPRMKVTISADHRAMDGARAAIYLREFKHLLEDPMSLLE
jgi:pyruvate dehydrogenase E2 component (dihydrolipoamide acetyltransferase)